MKDQCKRKSSRGRACLLDAEPEHDLHMNIGESWPDPNVSPENHGYGWVPRSGVLSDMDARIQAEPLDVLGRPRAKTREETSG